MTLQSIDFKFSAKLKKGSCIFCCLSCISLNPTSHLNNYFMFIAKERLDLSISVVLLLLSKIKVLLFSSKLISNLPPEG